MQIQTRAELIDLLATYNQEAEYYAQKCFRLEKTLAALTEQLKAKQSKLDQANYQLSCVQLKLWQDSRQR